MWIIAHNVCRGQSDLVKKMSDLAKKMSVTLHRLPAQGGRIKPGGTTMSLGTILLIILVIFLLGGFSGRFGGYGYGFGHSGVGVIGVILIIVVVLMLFGRL